MDSNLVRLTTQDVGKGIPITDTIIVAEKFKILRKSIIRLIEDNLEDFLFFGELGCFENTPVGKQRSQKEYTLNEEQFYLLLTYVRNNPTTKMYKKQFVKQFSLMKKELTARQETRHIGIAVRKSLTDTIKNKVDEGTNFKKFAYSTYSKLIYKKVFGKDVKKIKEERRVPPGKNVRDYFTIDELERIQEMESKIATYIEMRKNLSSDKEIYQEIKEIL